jgi:uncharacterized membrane protein SpoIIM required for sporulation
MSTSRRDPGRKTPRSVEFRKRREAEWRTLSDLVDRVLRRGLTSLDESELEALPRLYRATLSSLSVARRTAMDRQLIAYLEALSARAYLAVYGTRRTRRGALVRSLTHTFPRRVRAMWPELLMSLGITALGALVSWTLVGLDPAWYYAFVDPALAGDRDPTSTTEHLRSVLYSDGDGGSLSFFASWLFTHNAGIGLTAFGLGFIAGVPTAYLLFTNGLMLGAFLRLYAERGLLLPLLGWLGPHGIPEIGAVILCGAAGFHLARGLLLPGERSTREAMAYRGRRAAIVVLGSVVLFAIAGVIEGVFRQVVDSDTIRFAMTGINAAWFFGWLLLMGRGGPREEPR